MLPALLRIKAQGGDGTCFQSLEADLFPGFFAVTVVTFIDAFERLVDLRDQFAVSSNRSHLHRRF